MRAASARKAPTRHEADATNQPPRDHTMRRTTHDRPRQPPSATEHRKRRRQTAENEHRGAGQTQPSEPASNPPARPTPHDARRRQQPATNTRDGEQKRQRRARQRARRDGHQRDKRQRDEREEQQPTEPTKQKKHGTPPTQTNAKSQPAQTSTNAAPNGNDPFSPKQRTR